MSEIAQLFESALRSNRANLLRKAAMKTVSQMAPDTTLRKLLDSDAGGAVRELSLREFTEALAEMPGVARRVRRPATMPSQPERHEPTSREEMVYREILEELRGEALTIGQLAKRLGLETVELRGYLTWMRKMGKVSSRGRARATRYFVET